MNDAIIHTLIQGCKQNDSSAQLKIYELYAPILYNTALRLVKNSLDAEEIMQDAFLQGFHKINSYRGEASLLTWLRKIVVYRSLNHLNKATLRTEILKENQNNLYKETIDSYTYPSVQRIQKAIAQLPNRYRVVLTLHLIEGYDHEEISSILQIKSSTSRSQYTRAKEKLKQMLKNQDYVRQA